MNEAVIARRADGLFVKPLGLDLVALQARNLRADQRGSVLEVFRTVLGPYLKLPVMRVESGALRRVPIDERSQAAAQESAA